MRTRAIVELAGIAVAAAACTSVTGLDDLSFEAVNGVDVAQATPAGPIADTNASFGIAVDPGNTPFSGHIDEVAVYDQALRADRVMAHSMIGMRP